MVRFPRQPRGFLIGGLLVMILKQIPIWLTLVVFYFSSTTASWSAVQAVACSMIR